MLVSSAANFEVSRARGFDLAGMKRRHRRKAELVQAGDRVLFYLTGLQAFGGTATATGPYFESHEPIWSSKKAEEEYPFRFPIRPDVILEPAQFVKAETLLPQLEWVKKWPPAHWQLAFQGNVHQLPEHDFATIESALRAAKAAPVG
ncbi:MAG: EVE domain-containing protein [Chloroflexota bacterium]|nr:EVE domain-containing protein [Dehalococcoidia bacterium]MDW8252397.1 EVE domain-containing protein [Chloroflexota bacterium]